MKRVNGWWLINKPSLDDVKDSLYCEEGFDPIAFLLKNASPPDGEVFKGKRWAISVQRLPITKEVNFLQLVVDDGQDDYVLAYKYERVRQ